MKYPQVTTEVKLYELSHYELRDLARQAVEVAEPKRKRIAIKAGIAIAAISIVGLPIAYILKTHRDAELTDKKNRLYSNLDKIARLQEKHDIKEAFIIEWRGNQTPYITMNPDTALIWKAANKFPHIAKFDLPLLRYNMITNPETALLPQNLFDDYIVLDPVASDAAPSYGASVDEPPPPNYDELETRP